MDRERKTIDDWLRELHRMYRRLRYMAYTMIGLLLLTLVISFLRSYMLILGCLAAALLFRFLIFRRAQKSYMARCEEANLALTACRELTDCTMGMRGGLCTAELEKAELLPMLEKGGALYRGLEGRKDALHVRLSDCSFAERQGVSGIAAEINTGCWTSVEGFGSTGQELRVIEEGLFPEALRESFFRDRGFRELTPPSGFPKRLHFYGRTGEELKSMPAGFLSGLSALAGYTPGKLGLSLRDGRLDVYIRDRFLCAPFSAKQEVSREQLLRDPFPERKHIVELALHIHRKDRKEEKNDSGNYKDGSNPGSGT